ncbi:3'-5' exonuclease [Algoriphagus aestuarii]|nr:3'-5' exonuclease [Algoriphagus aestuarii]
MSWGFFKRSGRKQRHFVKEFLESSKRQIPAMRKIDQLSFVVLDTETTGLDPANDHVLSCGAVKIESQTIRVSSAKEWYLKSSKKGRETVIVHELLGTNPTIELENFGQDFLQYLGQSILVGHHLGFDLAMLQKALAPFGFSTFPNPRIDTMSLAIRLDYGLLVDRSRINLRDYSLDALCERFKIKTDDRHTAGGDAFLTAKLFLKLLKIAEKKGIENWGLLQK